MSFFFWPNFHQWISFSFSLFVCVFVCVCLCHVELFQCFPRHLMTSSVDSDLGDISNLNDVQPFCNIADDANNLGFDKNHLCCASVNLNSILYGDRLSQIESILKCNNLGILAVQESKLNNTKHPSTYHIDNFSVIAKHRPTGGRGGGLLLYLRNDIPFRQLTNLESNSPTLEHICCM